MLTKATLRVTPFSTKLCTAQAIKARSESEAKSGSESLIDSVSTLSMSSPEAPSSSRCKRASIAIAVPVVCYHLPAWSGPGDHDPAWPGNSYEYVYGLARYLCETAYCQFETILPIQNLMNPEKYPEGNLVGLSRFLRKVPNGIRSKTEDLMIFRA